MEEGFLTPEKVLRELNLRDNLIAVDFGCGSGGWVLPLAKILTQGRIYAIDILEEPLSALRFKLKSERVFNVETRRADVERGVPLPSNFADLVLMSNLLFECKDIKKVLEEGKRILRKGGWILVVDWKEEAGNVGPEKKVPKNLVKNLAKELGLEIEREFEAGRFHYGIVFFKP